jgi:hypothetical protein
MRNAKAISAKAKRMEILFSVFSNSNSFFALSGSKLIIDN